MKSKNLIITLIVCVMFMVISTSLYSKGFTISGNIKDKENGEALIGATIYVSELKTGTVTNAYGFYSITIPEGTYKITFSFIGYQPIEKEIILYKNISFSLELEEKEQVLKEVTITGQKANDNVANTETGTFKVPMEQVKKIPALMGEIDLLKAIQLMPGVQTAAEGTSGFSVRGGNTDQNLILLDEATVYSASHLMGFFSVFNTDAIKDLKIYKGDIPAQYGGRLSSLVDVRMKEGNMKRLTAAGGIGTISSRLTVEGPLVKDKSSFIFSGRRTYADIFLALSSDTLINKNKLHFYDLNGKVNFIINEKNRLFVSAYSGEDVFSYDKMFGFSFGNQTLTARWNRLFSSRLFSNFTLIYSKYKYQIGQSSGADGFNWQSSLTDLGAKIDFNYFLNPKNNIKFGLSFIHHKFNPGVIHSIGSTDTATFEPYRLPQSRALEYAIYLSNEQKIGSRLTVDYGLRFSVFQNIGFGTVYGINNQFTVTDTTYIPTGDIYNTYYGLEPRISASLLITENSSIKASYARSKQYIQLAQNSTAGSPLDIWFPSGPNIKPQVSDQVALGYFHNFLKNSIETSIEVYYKKMDNQIDYRDHAMLMLNAQLDAELRFGTAESYGIEFLIRKSSGKFSGWISYTLSKAERTFKDINNGNPYPAPYDRTHNISIVLNYDITKKFTAAATWVFQSGNPVTLPTGRFYYGNTVIPVYSDRNSYRMPDYHRLDVALTYKFNPEGKFRTELNLSVYNCYARKNAWMISFEADETDGNRLQAYKTYLFSVVPALTFNFYF